MKFVIALFALIFAMSIGLSFGPAHAMQAVPSGGSGGSMGYTCTSTPGQTSLCECEGLDDCLAMDDAGVCVGETADGGLVTDVSCTPGFSSCSCTWQQSQSPVPDLQPESQSPGTNMAPADEALSPRERRNRHRDSSVTQPRNSRDHRSGSNTDDNETEDDSETVPARRGQPRPRTTLPDLD